MSDSFIAIIGIILAFIIMFIFPLIELGGKNDEIAQTIVQTAVSDFANNVATKGKITRSDYDALETKLASTGNSFDIELEVKILDDNPRRATTTANPTLIGEYKYYSVYTNTILEEMNSKNEYMLKNDDYIIVTVKNTNVTIGTQLKNFLYDLIGKESYTIGASASALVLNSGKVNIALSEGKVKDEYTNITLTKMSSVTEPGQKLDVVVILDCEMNTMLAHSDPYLTPDNLYGVPSEDYINDIYNAISPYGNIKFILTAQPEEVYTRDELISLLVEKEDANGELSNELYDILSEYCDYLYKNETGDYVTSFGTAFEILNKNADSNEKECLVFLSYNHTYEKLRDAKLYLKENQNLNKFDLFFTTYCCVYHGFDGGWGNGLGEKWGGNISRNSSMETRFEELVKIATESEVASSDIIKITADSKVTLGNNIDTNREMIIIINGNSKKVGTDISEDVIYYDNDKGEYVLDISKVLYYEGIASDDFSNTDIELTYYITT